jgi:Uri superfamily endonuclease
MEPGIYTLLLRLDHALEIAVGLLGRIVFSEGYYAYTGSARGSGGLKRVERHLQVLSGERTARRWHIDYLLPHARFQEAIVTPTAEDLECQIARRIGQHLLPIPGFGCTDCRCTSHLHYSTNLEEALSASREAHRRWQETL